MRTITQQEFAAGELGRSRTRIDLNPRDFSTGNKRRTLGLHLTDVIRDIMLDTGINRNDGTFADEQLANFQLHGYLWEDVFTEKLRDYLRAGDYAALGLDPQGEYVRLGEIAYNGENAYFVDDAEHACPTCGIVREDYKVDATGKEQYLSECPNCGSVEPPVHIPPPGYIIMSPDGARIFPERLLELKWTTLSLNMDPDKKRMEWGIQKKGYLAGLNALLVAEITEVECPVLFACGDYRASGPVHEMWNERYSLTEIADNWAMIYGHAEFKKMWD